MNNNGNVTFGADLGEYTPEDLTGQTTIPIIAPFFADVDTRALGSNLVTYGSSPDGNTFCVNWSDVGYYREKDDKLNTFQLLLRKNTSGAGRVAGDFDITFNYDRIEWETGSASGGTNGFGGTSATSGFSLGTGAPGTFVQLTGSLVNGALLDSGPNALVSSSQGSTQPGRYVFQVRNEGAQASFGSLSGKVERESNGAPVVGAFVEICSTVASSCFYTRTDPTGAFTYSGLRSGSYDVDVASPDDDLFGGGTSVEILGGERTNIDTIRLQAPAPPPAGTTITNVGVADNGVPSVLYTAPLSLRVSGCPGVAHPTTR